MSETIFSRAKEVFLEACDLQPQNRAAFLEFTCGEDSVLRNEVDALLENDAPFASEHSDGLPSVFFGTLEGFEVIRQIGCGGMGDVWEAEQLKPVRRRVALKLIRSGIASDDVLARFETERQALALMNHINIATVFEAGATAEGRPYFAMELVDGPSITEFCDTERLGLDQRLALFVEICEGIQHAHHKGVIHRDIKPSNILIANENGRPIPKIIDFGVAKATSQRLSEKCMLTEKGLWLGTPEYMSPEQAGLTNMDVDTRTDVYALGVLLYELLAGTQPFDAHTLRSAGFGEMCRILCEEDPPRPSTRVGNSADFSRTIAHMRRTNPSSLARRLRGDLDWIVMRTLEKDRDRRYGSPADLAADIGRYLGNESVHARPPSAANKARKFVVRHRAGVVTAAAIVLALLVGVVGTSIGMIRARRDAEATRRVAESMSAVLQTLNPYASDRHLATARRALIAGTEVIESQLEDQPVVRGRLLMMMGRTYISIADFRRAAELLQLALQMLQEELGNDDPALAEVHGLLGWCLFQLGDSAAAQVSLERTLAIREANDGPEHVTTGSALAHLGMHLCRIGDYERSKSLLERAEQIFEEKTGPESDYIAEVLHFKGVLLIVLGDYDAARETLERSVAIRQHWLGRDHAGVAGSLADLAMVTLLQGDEDLAEEMFRRALDINRRAFGEDHYSVAYPLRELGGIEATRGNFAAAEKMIAQSLEISEKAVGPEHSSLLWILRAQSSLLRRKGNLAGARTAIERALSIAESSHGPVHFEVALILGSLGLLEYEVNNLTAADEVFGREHDILAAVFPPKHRLIGVNAYQRACISALRGERDVALAYLRTAISSDWSSDIIFEDPDLNSLRGDPDFESILEDWRRQLDG